MRFLITLAASIILLILPLSQSESVVNTSESGSKFHTDVYGKITITGEGELRDISSQNGWPGNGSESEPYIISDFELDSAGGTYGFRLESISSHVVIRNVTFYNASGQGNSGSPGAGLDIRECQGIVISNCTGYRNTVGIWVEGSTSVKILNSSFSNGTSGARLQSCSGINVTGCSFGNNSAFGLRLFDTHHSNITHSLALNNNLGMDMTSSDSNTVRNNNCSRNDDHGVRLYTSSFSNVIENRMYGNDDGVHIYGGSNNTVENNSIKHQVEYGIYLEDTENNRISENKMFGCSFMLQGTRTTFVDQSLVNNTVNGLEVYHLNSSLSDSVPENRMVGQIIMGGIEGITLNNITSRGGSNGITIAYSENCTVYNSTLSGMAYSGLLIESSTEIEIFNCRFSDGFKGISSEGSEGIGIRSSVFENHSWGMDLIFCTRGVVEDNAMSNGNSGIRLHETRESICSDNLFFMMDDTAISVGPGAYFNRISKNTVNSCSLAVDVQFSGSNTISENSIRFANNGITVSGFDCEIRNNSLLNFQGMGITTNIGANSIINNTLESDGGTGIMVSSGGNLVLNNTINIEHDTGIYVSSTNTNRFYSNSLGMCNFDFAGTGTWDQILPQNNTVNGKPVIFLHHVEEDFNFPELPGQILLFHSTGMNIRNHNMAGVPSFIYLQDCLDILVEGISTSGIGNPLEIVRSRNIEIKGCSFTGGSIQIDIQNSARNITVNDCRFLRPSTRGLYLEYTTGMVLDGCKFIGGEEGMRMQSVGDITVKGCIFDDLKGGISAEVYSEDLKLNGNIFMDIEGEAIRFSGTHLVTTVQGNCFLDTGRVAEMEEEGPVFKGNHYRPNDILRDDDGDEISDVPYPVNNFTRDFTPKMYLPEEILQPPGLTTEMGEKPYNVSFTVRGSALGYGLETIGIEIFNASGSVVHETNRVETTGSFDAGSEGENHHFHARTVTRIGRSMRTEQSDLTLDWFPPEIEIISPTEGELVNVSRLPVVWSIRDNASMIRNYNLTLDDDPPVDRHAIDDLPGGRRRYVIDNLQDGHHTLLFQALDDYGHVASEMVRFSVDTTGPQIDVEEPENGSVTNQKSINVRWSLRDFSGVKETWIRIDDEDWLIGKGGRHTFRFLEEGEHEIRIRSVDIAGMESEKLILVRVDRTPPSVVEFKPEGPYVSNSQEPYFKLSEPVPDHLLNILLDGDPADKIVVGTDVWVDVVGTFEPGSIHIVTVNASDEADNTMEPFTWSFRIEPLPEEKPKGKEFWGTIVDDNGDPISDARILIDGEENSTTGSEGTFRIYLEWGAYELTIRAPGQNELKRNIIVNSTSDTNLGEFRLESKREGFPWQAAVAIALIWALLAAGIAIYLRTNRNRPDEE